MKKIRCEFENINFIINTCNKKDYNNQIQHIKKFYINKSVTCQKKNKKTVEIDYVTDENLFKKYLKMCKKNKGILLQSFENEIHKEIIFDNGTKIFIINSEEYILIKDSDIHYRILTDGRSSGIKWPFRLIREILVRENEDNAQLFMHGTGIELENNGILLLGNSGSGKTTLAVDFLLDDIKKGFISNDIVFLNQNNMYYFPIPIVFASGTVKNNTVLNKYFKTNKIYEQNLGIDFDKIDDDTKIPIPLTKIEEIFENTILKDKKNIDLIIFPIISKELNNKYIISDLTSRQKYIKLDSTCFTPYDSESLRLEWVKKRDKKVEEISEIKYDTFNSLIKNTDIIMLEYGINSNKKDIEKDLIR